jgi:hypothetical protein
LFVAVFFNADTIGISQSLWRDAALRSTTAQAALSVIEKGDQDQIQETLEDLSALSLPIGWVNKMADHDPVTPANPREIPSTGGEIILKSMGLLITGLAISQGSSIWFDILNRVVNMRSTGVKPQSGGIFESNG